MFKKTLLKPGILLCLLLSIPIPRASAQTQWDIVNGNLIVLNENGAWCWYQDERAVVDTLADVLLAGSVASGSGPGGSPRSGDIEAVLMDLHSMTPRTTLLKNGGGSAFYCDDHNAPAFLVRPDGKYLALYAAHFNDTSTYTRIYDAGDWGPENRFNWKQERPGGSNFQTTYSNVYLLQQEGRTVNFVRGNNKSPNSMVSMDMGESWTYGGQLATGSNVGYNNGYYKYNGNGLDRIDFVCTEYHPRDFNTSIYHGYIQDGRSYTSDGTLVDENVYDVDFIPDPHHFTTVFEAGTAMNGVTLYRCWNTDVQRYPDGTVATVVTARINNNTGGGDTSINPDHAFVYCRFDGTSWSCTYLGRAGFKLYSSEADYTGLAAMHPQNPNVLYISTTVDPRDDSNLRVHEIFKGVTQDSGATWDWSPVTWNSVRHNLRPIVPSWNDRHHALLWWRGTYNSAQNYDAAVVGIIENSDESREVMTYADADTTNTRLASGLSLEVTGPSGEQGSADQKWHLRSGFGNGGYVYASAELGAENAPAIRTEVPLPDDGTYDIWVNFWANPSYDWRIKAGLNEENMRLFRQMACQQVEDGDHTTTLVRTGDGNVFLYQAYLGRVYGAPHLSHFSVMVYVDDEPVQNGTTGTRIGNTARTWYDGVSYARVGVNTAVAASAAEFPQEARLSQNYPNPFNPVTTIPFTLPESGDIRLALYDILGREEMLIASGRFEAGHHEVTFDAGLLPSGVYFYRLEAGKSSRVMKMILMR